MKKIYIVSNSTWNIINFRNHLIKKLYNLNYEIIISAPKDGFLKSIDQNKYSYVPISYNRKSENIINNLKIIIFYIKEFILKKPDYIFLYTIKPNIFASISTFFVFRKVKYYNFVTGMGTAYFEHNLKKKFILYLYKFAFLHTKKVIFQNKSDQKYFVKNKIISKNKSSIIPGSGVDTKFFKFTEIKDTNLHNLKFLCVSRIISQKGILELIKAAKLIYKDFKNIQFTLIGSSDDENKSSINLNPLIKSNININHISHTDKVFEYIRQCDCFILPSYREGTSRSILEAASVGRPIITTDVPGCNNIVKNNINGYLCRPKDHISLYKSIYKMIYTNFSKRKNMSINSRKIAEKYFDINIINDEIIKLLK